MTSGYAYDQAWHDERARLAGIEALWDAGTRDLLIRSGVGEGARVLEAGAGGGSVVEWLASTVGSGGHVLAVDLDVRFVEPLASPTVEVRQADLTRDELPEAAFDVVHTRLVLEHLSERDAVLDRLIAALRPGGVLVVEDYDWTAFGFESADPAQDRAADGILQFMGAAGFDRSYGRRLVGDLADHGLSEVAGEGRSLVIGADHPGFAFFALSFEQLAPSAIEAGYVDAADAALTTERLALRTGHVVTPTMVAATGRR